MNIPPPFIWRKKSSCEELQKDKSEKEGSKKIQIQTKNEERRKNMLGSEKQQKGKKKTEENC